mgnify:CR=1 FL=1
MFKNLTETKQGKRLLYGLGMILLVVVSVVIYSFFAPNGETGQASTSGGSTEGSTEETVFGQYSGQAYSGRWYSSREDKMLVDLNADGTYRTNSTWLADGMYYLTGQNIMVFEDNQGEKKEFQLQTRMGNTVMYLREEDEEIFLYPSQQLKEQMEAEDSQQLEAAQEVINQAWTDVLTQGKWETFTSGFVYTISFSENEFVQEKIDRTDDSKETVTFSYRIASMVGEGNGVRIVMNRVDERDRMRDITFTIIEENGIYRLSGTPGTFTWNSSFETKAEEIELTQSGLTREDASDITSVTTDEDGNRVVISEREVSDDDNE